MYVRVSKSCVFPLEALCVVGCTSSARRRRDWGARPEEGESVSYGTCFVPRDVFVSDVKEKIIKVNYRARR